MTPWTPFTEENVRKSVPQNLLGVFQLSRDGKKISLVERADSSLRDSLFAYVGKGYTHFQWVSVPWTKEGFEMHCRLYHHGGGKTLDNIDHPYPPEGKQLRCPMSSQPPALCDL